MIEVTAKSKNAVLRALRKRPLTTLELLDALCPPPKFTADQVMASVEALIGRGRVAMSSGRGRKLRICKSRSK
jgi:hypothetical protein